MTLVTSTRVRVMFSSIIITRCLVLCLNAAEDPLCSFVVVEVCGLPRLFKHTHSLWSISIAI